MHRVAVYNRQLPPRWYSELGAKSKADIVVLDNPFAALSLADRSVRRPCCVPPAATRGGGLTRASLNIGVPPATQAGRHQALVGDRLGARARTQVALCSREHDIAAAGRVTNWQVRGSVTSS